MNLGLPGAALIGREVKGTVESKIETEHALFYPFYEEEHGIGVFLDPSLLPEDLEKIVISKIGT